MSPFLGLAEVSGAVVDNFRLPFRLNDCANYNRVSPKVSVTKDFAQVFKLWMSVMHDTRPGTSPLHILPERL